jgi:hypothetical protein
MFFVSLKPKVEGEPMVIDTLEKAIDALNELGLCMNWAVATGVKDHPRVVLVYEGWTYRHSFERFVELPFDEESPQFASLFQKLLSKIFAPFVLNDDVARNLISVTPNPEEKDCYFVTLLLMFIETEGAEGEKLNAIHKSLDKVDDAQDPLIGKIFWLD